jgi:HEAT repeat protein
VVYNNHCGCLISEKEGKIMTLRYRQFFGRVFICLLFGMLTISSGISSAAEDLRRIREDLNNIDWQVRVATVEKLRNATDEKSVSLLMEVVNTREERTPVKMSAIQLLGEAGDPRAVEVLLPIFNDATLNWECPALKSYTATALGSFKGDTRVVDALISGIDDRELLTREASIRSLGKVGSQKAVPFLIRALSDEHISIRLSAIKALEEIGNPQAIPHLQRIAEKENDSVVKGQAETALRKFAEAKNVTR